jgi:hypothetical protein
MAWSDCLIERVQVEIVSLTGKNGNGDQHLETQMSNPNGEMQRVTEQMRHDWNSPLPNFHCWAELLAGAEPSLAVGRAR